MCPSEKGCYSLMNKAIEGSLFKDFAVQKVVSWRLTPTVITKVGGGKSIYEWVCRLSNIRRLGRSEDVAVLQNG
jgi:hypothetical protein